MANGLYSEVQADIAAVADPLYEFAELRLLRKREEKRLGRYRRVSVPEQKCLLTTPLIWERSDWIGGLKIEERVRRHFFHPALRHVAGALR